MHLIDGKRTQNVSIGLGRVKISNDDVRAALVALDPSLLSPEGTEVWMTLIPTPEEYEACAGYPGDAGKLAKVRASSPSASASSSCAWSSSSSWSSPRFCRTTARALGQRLGDAHPSAPIFF